MFGLGFIKDNEFTESKHMQNPKISSRQKASFIGLESKIVVL